MPPSVVLWAAALCPPLRTASSSPVSFATAMTRATSEASATRTITAGMAIHATHDDGAGSVVVGVAGPDDPTGDVGAKLRDEVGWTGRRSLHDGLLSGESVELDLERASRQSGSRGSSVETRGVA